LSELADRQFHGQFQDETFLVVSVGLWGAGPERNGGNRFRWVRSCGSGEKNVPDCRFLG